MLDDPIEDEMLTLALSEPADYSSNFDRVVEELCAKLSQALGTTFFRDSHMDHSSAQAIELWLDKAHEPVNRRSDASYVIRTSISSKGSFFASHCITQDSPRHWLHMPLVEHDESIQSYIQKIEQLLADEGYVALPEAVLFQRAEGHLTKLDNLPATVYGVLFSELW